MVNPSAADTVYSFLEIALAANAGFKNDKNNPFHMAIISYYLKCVTNCYKNGNYLLRIYFIYIRE